ncbi:FK506-binding protein 4-like [Salvia miltiorrhiza]|uniref:FK506-binding protein 4-like n=1 Tax=Salvia miltiorrhiza TaxID=226208 RepID=UPI0025AD9666|nr:FK506-binding protein 4-like [Salvia miltiorrhiza]
MVSTRPKNKLRGIPQGTEIDLTEESPSPSKPKTSKKTPRKKPLSMETTPTPSSKTLPQPESPSPVDEHAIEQLTAEIDVPTLGAGDQHAAEEEGKATPEKAKEGEEEPSKKKRTPTIPKRKKPAAEKSATPAEGSSNERNKPSGSVLQSEQGESGEEQEETPAKRRRKVMNPTPIRMIKGEPASASRSKKKGIAVLKIPDMDALKPLGIVEKVKEYFNNIGWKKIFGLARARIRGGGERSVRVYASRYQPNLRTSGHEFLHEWGD